MNRLAIYDRLFKAPSLYVVVGFPVSTKPNGTSAGEQNGDRAAEEPRLSGAAAAVPETSKAPIGSLFVPRSSERMAERALRAGSP
jgi:hypothetical protein